MAAGQLALWHYGPNLACGPDFDTYGLGGGVQVKWLVLSHSGNVSNLYRNFSLCTFSELKLSCTRNSRWRRTSDLPTAHPSFLSPHHVKVVTGTGAVRPQRLTAVASLIILTAIVAPLQFASL